MQEFTVDMVNIFITSSIMLGSELIYGNLEVLKK